MVKATNPCTRLDPKSWPRGHVPNQMIHTFPVVPRWKGGGTNGGTQCVYSKDMPERSVNITCSYLGAGARSVALSLSVYSNA